MVKCGKKIATSGTNKKQNEKENFEVYVLMRDIVSDVHHVIQRSKVISSKKLQKLEPGDEISFGQRGGRMRGIILMIGTGKQCKNSLCIIQKANTSNSKMDKSKNKNVDEAESKTDDMNYAEADENNEDILSVGGEEDDSAVENDSLHIDEATSLKTIATSTSFNRSQSTNTINGSVQSNMHVTLQRQINSLEAQALEYQTMWMRE
ncbi:unnamed protein product [Rotaria sp. Silwood1]|nr:unnamed protein product [Rotaria sp. Silwood1]CAF1687733.1 unnamed protein product [Rotaria sp. Silwood1]CAF5007381.1 unnamed protein product [Rotaria sp. Silwood1]